MNQTVSETLSLLTERRSVRHYDETFTLSQEEVKELRSAFVEGRKKLMELKKESSIRRKLIDKGLAPSEVPPKKIKVTSKN